MGSLRLVWFCSLGTLLYSAGAAIQTVTPPFQIDTTLVAHVAYRYQAQVAAASNCFLMAWLDLRDTYDYFPRVYGARIERDGTTTNFTGTPLSNPFHESWPNWGFDLASDGQTFLAVWHSESPANSGIHGVLIGNEAIPASPELILTTNVAAKAVAVTAYEGGYFVAWTEPRAGLRWLLGARVTSLGNVIDPNGIPLTRVKWDDSPVKLAGQGNSIVAAFSHWVGSPTDGADAVAVVITVGETVTASAPLALATGPQQQTVEAVASWHGRFLVVWQGDFPGSADGGIWGSFVMPEAEASAPFRIWGDDSHISGVSIVPTQDGGLMAWRATWSTPSRTEWRSSALDRNGSFLNQTPFPFVSLRATPYPLELAAHSEVVIVPRNAGSIMIAAPGREVVYNDNFIRSTPNQTSAAIASNGKQYMVIWADDRWKTNWFLFGRRFDWRGSPLDAQSFQLDPGAYGSGSMENWIGRPVLASCGKSYLILLRNQYRHIYGKRIFNDGSVADHYLEITPTATAGEPALAGSKDRFLAVWESRVNADFDIQARWISPNGGMGPLLELESTTADARHPAVAAVGRDFLVIWTHRTSSFVNRFHGALVSGKGVIEQPGELNLPSNGNYELGTHQRQYLFVSTANPDYGVNGILGAFIDRKGQVVHTETFYTNRNTTLVPPAVGSTKARSLVVWHDATSTNTTIWASEITARGAVHAPMMLGEEADYVTLPAVSLATSASAMIVTESYGPSQRRTLSGRVVRFTH
jgi:hypothetical protein